MKRLLAVVPLATLLAAGCSDDPTVPERALSVTIERSSAAVEEETLRVGATLQLEARVVDEAGADVRGEPVKWSSGDPAVAEVSAAGLVTGRTPGFALIVASAGRGRDTARVNVVEPLTGTPSCDPGQGLSLAVGEAHVASGFDAPTLCVAGGGGSEYVLVPFYASGVASASLGLSLAAAGVAPVSGPPSPARAPTPFQPTGARADDGFHLRLRDRVAPTALTPARAGAPERGVRAAAVPIVGEEMRLNVETSSDDACSDPDLRTGRVAAVTERAIIVADVANPPGGFTDADYAGFGRVFDDLIHPVGTANFGEPSDIDGNGRSIVFFTRAVNELTPQGSTSYIGGFFYSRDLFSRTGQSACVGSNEAEVFYMMVPDPAGTVNGNVRTREFVRQKTVAVLAHEFQHLINDSRRLFVNRTADWEEKWLGEGLSHVAEELVFYAAAGLQPGGNLDAERIRAAGAEPELAEYLHDNFERLASYLQSASRTSLIGTSDDLATRGAAWSFLRYAADRRGGSERALWQALVRDARSSGLANLRDALGGEEPLDWARDWGVAVYTDDALPGLPARFTQPSWNHRALFPELGSLADTRHFTAYPLQTLPLQDGATRPLTLRAGGAAHLRFAVPAGGTAAVRTGVGGLPGPSRLQLVLVRTR